MSALLRRTRKKHRSVVKKKLPLKCRTKRHRFSSLFFSEDEDERGSESDISSHAPVESYRISDLPTASSLPPLSLGQGGVLDVL